LPTISCGGPIDREEIKNEFEEQEKFFRVNVTNAVRTKFSVVMKPLFVRDDLGGAFFETLSFAQAKKGSPRRLVSRNV